MGLGGTWGRWSGREFGRTQTDPEERLLKNIFFFHLLPFYPTMFSWIKDSFKWMDFSFKMQTYPSENKTPFFIQLFIWNMLIKLLAFRKNRYLLQWEELREFIFKQTLSIILHITLKHLDSLSESFPEQSLGLCLPYSLGLNILELMFVCALCPHCLSLSLAYILYLFPFFMLQRKHCLLWLLQTGLDAPPLQYNLHYTVLWVLLIFLFLSTQRGGRDVLPL